MLKSIRIPLVYLLAIALTGCSAMGTRDNADTMRELQGLKSQLKAMNDRLDRFEERLQQDPQMARFDVKLGDSPRLGSPDATVAVVEFADYQCPYCQRFQSLVFPFLKKSYIDDGKVLFIFKNLPLDFHAHAHGAAIAATCAGEQGKYWDYQAALFDHQDQLGNDYYVEVAKKQELDIDRFEECLQDKAAAAKVDADLTYGGALGVDGTPSFFIGRLDENANVADAVRIVGAQPLPVFEQTIDGLLKARN